MPAPPLSDYAEGELGNPYASSVGGWKIYFQCRRGPRRRVRVQKSNCHWSFSDMQETLKPSYVGKTLPPYSNEVTQLRSTSASAKSVKILAAIVGVAVIVGIVWFIGRLFFWKWSTWAALAIGAYFLFENVRGILKSQCAACPFCHKDVGSGSLLNLSFDDQGKQFACESCFEWLISDKGQIRAFRETDIGDRKQFDCPVFANGVWPNECIVCGAPPTRHLNARTFNVGLGTLLIGKLSVSYGSVKNIPYCNEHKDAVTVKSFDRKIWADFNDYSARRRYLNTNRVYHMNGGR
jgi:hypothetical protein